MKPGEDEIEGLKRRLDDRLAPPVDSVSLQDWVMRLAYRSTGASVFGPTFNTDVMWDDWELFDTTVWKVALGFPPSYCTGYVAARERVLEEFKRYLSKPHDTSQFIAEQIQLSQDSGFNERDQAVTLTAAWWPLMANVPWGSVVSRNVLGEVSPG